jgi:hypothetical protein
VNAPKRNSHRRMVRAVITFLGLRGLRLAEGGEVRDGSPDPDSIGPVALSPGMHFPSAEELEKLSEKELDEMRRWMS